MPAVSDQLLRDLRGARGWVFVLKLSYSLACVIDTSISKVLGCHSSIRRDAGGDTHLQSNNNERPNILLPKPPR